MKAVDDPAGMTDAELERAALHHQHLGESYQRIADTHWKASNTARDELERRQRDGARTA